MDDPADRRTLAVYAERAQDYAQLAKADDTTALDAFAAHIAPGGRVLDLGCGPGHASRDLANKGFSVEAWDASPEMIDLATSHDGVLGRVAVFSDLDAEVAFDGIWASYALLHARRVHIPDLIQRIARALHVNGVVYVSMKLGRGEARDTFGRRYAYVGAEELAGWMETAGLRIIQREEGTARALSGEDEPVVAITATRL